MDFSRLNRLSHDVRSVCGKGTPAKVHECGPRCMNTGILDVSQRGGGRRGEGSMPRPYEAAPTVLNPGPRYGNCAL